MAKQQFGGDWTEDKLSRDQGVFRYIGPEGQSGGEAPKSPVILE